MVFAISARCADAAAFGDARRPAGVLEDARVCGRDRDIGLLAVVCRQQVLEPVMAGAQRDRVALFPLAREGEERARQRRQVLLDVADDDGPQAGVGLDLAHGRVEEAERDGVLDLRVVELLAHPGGGERGVGGDDNPACLEDGVEGDHERGAVGHHKRHAVALLHAQVNQAGGERVGLAVECAVGERRRLPAEKGQPGGGEDRRIVGEPGGGLLQKGEHRLVRVVERRRDPGS
ncbi:MAG: hypothetical protein M5R40_26935 [Anaerolineae bacterium]|nr:hypothetical protein [Anaerolineae bacterium]